MSEPPITNNQSPATGSDSPVTSRQSLVTDQEDEISLLDLAIVLAKHKKLILGLPLVVAVIAAGISLLLPDIYTATTKILPPQQSQSASAALLAQLGGVAAGLLGGGGRSSNEVYIAMLKSRTVKDKLIHRGLIGGAKRPSQARAGPPEVATITTGRDGLITIEVDGPDPKRAADLANAYVEELEKFTQVLAVTEASQRRLFFERQFAQAKDNLANAEVTARQALERGGLVKVDEQGRAMLEATARLRGQITVKEVQISAMRTFAAERNPDLRLAQQELESMKRELGKIEGTGSAKAVEKASGGKGIDNLYLLRDLKYYETIYELLAKQYEMAKIDEAKDTSIIQVMDKAVEPESTSKPRRGLIVLVSALMALFVGILLAFVREVMAKTMAKASVDPQLAKRLQTIKHYLAWR